MQFIDLTQQAKRIENDVRRRMDAVLEHGQFILGPEVRQLEQQLAERAGVAHCITCSSGTDALILALRALGIGPGDGVYVPAFTFVATASAVRLVGATPIFVDVEEDTFNVSARTLQEAFARQDTGATRGGSVVSGGHSRKPRPRAIIAVDLFGQPAPYPELERLARAHDLALLADAAQSLGATLDGLPVGRLAPISTTSFFPSKPLGCYGDGGAVFTNDGQLADWCRSIRVHGKGTDKYDCVRVGMNARLDTLQAAILLAKLEIFDEELESRRRIADGYRARLSGLPGITPQRIVSGASSAWAQFTLRSPRRDRLAEVLRENGVPSMVYYPKPLHLQVANEDLGQGVGSFPRAEALCQQVLSLPMHPYLTEQEQEQVCSVISKSAQ